MNAKSSVVFHLLIRNVVPRSHTSDAPKSLLPLMWCIMNEVQVDIARLIANKLKEVTLNLVTGAKGILPFPALIMGLLRENDVVITPTDTEIENPIDDTFISGFVKREERAAQYHFSDDEQGPSTGPFDMTVFQNFMQEQNRHNQYVKDQNSYLMDQNEAIYRSNRGIQ
jgi:hypothetical protein